MKLSARKHGEVNAHYYEKPLLFHTYKLDGRTAATKLNWMFKHITERRPDLNKKRFKASCLRRRRGTDDQPQARWQNVTLKTGKNYLWHEETVPNFATMHEGYDYNL